MTQGTNLGQVVNLPFGTQYIDALNNLNRAIDALAATIVVKDVTIFTPPVSPSADEAYLIPVGSTPTGAWASQDGTIAVWRPYVTTGVDNTPAPKWDFYQLKNGWIIKSITQNTTYQVAANLSIAPFGGNPFDQNLNTTNNAQFNGLVASQYIEARTSDLGFYAAKTGDLSKYIQLSYGLLTKGTQGGYLYTGSEPAGLFFKNANIYFDVFGVKQVDWQETETINLDDLLGLNAPNCSATFYNISGGTYTPTLTNVTNITASTPYLCRYYRVGNIVTVSGRIDYEQTSNGAFEIGLSLPINSNIAAIGDISGSGASGNGAKPFAVFGDFANNRASIIGDDNSHANHSYSFIFTYEII